MAITTGNQNNPNGLPDIIRMKALKGFRAVADGALQNVHPGEIVDMPRDTAVELRYVGRAIMTDEPKKRLSPEAIAEYYAEKRRASAPPDPNASLIAVVNNLSDKLAAVLTAISKTSKKD